MTHSFERNIRVHLPPGRYVVAVSGGVDSVVLLDMLAKLPHVELVVAHVDHGIRADSFEDLLLVRKLAHDYELPFYFMKISLGPHASEATAREVRYGFLQSLRQRLNAQAIVTAHHKDDLLETSLLHVMRGTGRRGLAGFNEHESIIRPLLEMNKKDLMNYSQSHNLVWREDSTNADTTYKRNAVRQKLLPSLERSQPGFREQWHEHAKTAAELNEAIERGLHNLLMLHVEQGENKWTFKREWFVSLPHEVAREVVVFLMKQAGVQDISKKRVEQLTIHLKTGKINTRYDCDKRWSFSIERSPQHRTILKLALK